MKPCTDMRMCVFARVAKNDLQGLSFLYPRDIAEAPFCTPPKMTFAWAQLKCFLITQIITYKIKKSVVTKFEVVSKKINCQLAQGSREIKMTMKDPVCISNHFLKATRLPTLHHLAAIHNVQHHNFACVNNKLDVLKRSWKLWIKLG